MAEITEQKMFTWTVEFSINECWVQDGFNLTKEKSEEMLDSFLPFAYPNEISVKIVKKPTDISLLLARGFSETKIKKMTAEEKDIELRSN